MADEPTQEPAPKDPATDPDAGAKKALDAERAARREAEKQLREIQARLKEIEDKDKSEVDKLRDQLAELTKERDSLATNSLRAEIAMSKGLTAAQAKRLVGSTREELEADADEILAAFPSQAGGAPPPPTTSPKPDLRGGSDPTEAADVDIRKVVESIPRGI